MMPFQMALLPFMWAIGNFTGSFDIITAFKNRPSNFRNDIAEIKTNLSLALYYLIWIFMHAAIVAFYLLDGFAYWVVPAIKEWHPNFHYVAGDFLPSRTAIEFYLGLVGVYTGWRKKEKIEYAKANPTIELIDQQRGFMIIARWHITTYILYMLSRIFPQHIHFDDSMFVTCGIVTALFALGEFAEKTFMPKAIK